MIRKPGESPRRPIVLDDESRKMFYGLKNTFAHKFEAQNPGSDLVTGFIPPDQNSYSYSNPSCSRTTFTQRNINQSLQQTLQTPVPGGLTQSYLTNGMENNMVCILLLASGESIFGKVYCYNVFTYIFNDAE